MSAQEATAILDVLAEKLSVPIEKLFAVYAVQGVTTIFSLLIFLVVSGIVLICNWKYKDEYEGNCVACATSALCCIGSFVVLLALLPDFIAWCYYPETYGIIAIIKVLK